MSTLAATNLKHASSASNNIVLDSSGNATFAGTPVPNSSFLRNRIINGGMDIWQRGTTFTNVSTATYTSDRFKTTTNGVNLTVTQDTTVPNITFKYSLKAVPASNATPTECAIRQVLEQQNIFLFGGKTVIASAWILCSKSSMKFRLGAQNATGGADVTQTASVTAGTWTYVTTSLSSYAGVTAWTGTTNDTGGFLDIGFVDSAALTTSDYIYITGVQLEVGTAATPFERRQYGQELALCQRYYMLSTNGYGWGYTAGAGNYRATSVSFPVTMRSSPTITLSSITYGSASSLTTEGINPNGFGGYVTTGGATNFTVSFTYAASIEL